MSFSIGEGYYNAKVSTDVDVDHGPCTIYVLDNGDAIVLYAQDPTLISFHREFVDEEDQS